MIDPEAEARRFRMAALLIFVLVLMAVYFLFEFFASKKQLEGIPGGGRRVTNDF